MYCIASRHRDVHRSNREDEGMKPGRKAKRIGVNLLLVTLCVLLLVAMLPVHEALWAQSKGFNVHGKASRRG